MAAITFDLRNPEAVAHELDEANRRLAGRQEVPASVTSLAEEVAAAISATELAELGGVDPYLWIDVQRAAMHAQSAVRDPDERARRRRTRVAIEQLRFLLARLSERASVSDEQPVHEVVRWLDGTLGSTTQAAKAELLGVSERTYQRWLAQQSKPSADDERRARIIARVVNQLRHSLTAPGVLDWFAHPRADLGGASPRQALEGNADRIGDVLTAALASRSPGAA